MRQFRLRVIGLGLGLGGYIAMYYPNSGESNGKDNAA